jgi:hypothetical protein
MELAMLILAFSNVSDLEGCGQWRFGCLNTIKSSNLVEEVMRWDGKRNLEVRHDTWYDLLGRIMLGRKFIQPGASCLISNWGWSMWISTFADVDPLEVVPGMLTVRHGVPSRNGERRNKIVDGPTGGFAGPPYQICENTGELATSRCTIDATVGTRMTGMRDDQFVVSVHFSFKDSKIRTGYRQMHRLRWNAFVLPECTHQPSAAVKLPIDTATITGTDGSETTETSSTLHVPRTCASLVRGNRAARWMAIIGADGSRQVILAGNYSCLSCSIQKASLLKGPLLVVC